MSDQQNTGGSNIRLMMGLIAGGFVVVVGGGYALFSYFAAPAPVSRVNLTRVSGASQVSAQEQPDYRELLHESNARGAQTAAASNGSFIASMPLQQDVITPKEAPKVAPAVVPRDPPRPQGSGRTQEQEKALTEARQKSLNALLAKMQAEPVSGDLPTAQLLGGKESGWAAWRDSQPGSAVQQASVRSRRMRSMHSRRWKWWHPTGAGRAKFIPA